MKRLKEALKVWNKEVFGILDLNIEKTVNDLNDLEDQITNGDCDPNQFNSKELVKTFRDQIHSKDSLLRQKART
jgi:hypothetical protein